VFLEVNVAIPPTSKAVGLLATIFMKKDYKEIIEDGAVIWAGMAIIPGLDIFDLFLIPLLKNILSLAYSQVFIMYYLTAVLVLIILAPEKLKRLYKKIRKVM